MAEMSPWFRFALAVLATWRVAHLLSSEDGPADILYRLRMKLGSSLAGKLMDCFSCLSLWVAAPFALFLSREPLDWALSWLALSGAACLVERVAPEARPPVLIHQVPEAEGDPIDALLRPEARQSEGRPLPTRNQ